MALLPVAEARALLLRRGRAIGDRGGAARRSRRPRARRGRRRRAATSRPSPPRPWTATRCGPPTSPPCRRRSTSSARLRRRPPLPGRRRRPGEAVRIFTGAPVPEGADTIVIQEDAERAGDGPSSSATAPRRDPYIRPAGGDFRRGARVAAPAGLAPPTSRSSRRWTPAASPSPAARGRAGRHRRRARPAGRRRPRPRPDHRPRTASA